MSKQLSFRPFNPDSPDDYAAYCAITNAVYPDYPETPDEIRFHDERREAKLKWGRFFAEEAGQSVGVASFGQGSGSYHPQRFHVDVLVPVLHEGKGVGSALYAHLMGQLAPFDPIALRSQARADHERAVRFAADRGFVEVMREQESRIDLSTFDPAPYAADLRRVEEQAIVIQTVAELRHSDPDYRAKLYDLGWAIAQDIPHTETLTRPSKEVWANRFDDPNYLPDGNFVAVDNGQYIGISALWGSQSNQELFVGTTGVLSSYRGRGIATALKVKATTWAKERGAPVIRTWNEVNNNGMLGINFRLGFVRQPQWIQLAKEIKKDETL